MLQALLKGSILESTAASIYTVAYVMSEYNQGINQYFSF